MKKVFELEVYDMPCCVYSMITSVEESGRAFARSVFGSEVLYMDDMQI